MKQIQKLEQLRHSLYAYVGAIHIHTTYSDGTGTVDEVINAAQKSKLDWIIITDHSPVKFEDGTIMDWEPLRARSEGYEKWHNNLLLITATEISPRYNHYLAFDVDEIIYPDENPQIFIDKVNELGGFGFLAHPDHSGTKLYDIPPYKWDKWEVEGYTGLGIWDLMTDFQDLLNSRLESILAYFFTPFFLKGANKETLKKWDILNQKRKIVAIGEIDNHAKPHRWLGKDWLIFPYEYAFKMIRNYILLPNKFTHQAENDISSVYQQLKQGHLYISNDYYNKAKGFFFGASNGEEIALMGDALRINDKISFLITLPNTGKIRMFKNGMLIKEEITEHIIYETNENGVYRVEVQQKIYGFWRSWIYSNPIYITS